MNILRDVYSIMLFYTMCNILLILQSKPASEFHLQSDWAITLAIHSSLLCTDSHQQMERLAEDWVDIEMSVK